MEEEYQHQTMTSVNDEEPQKLQSEEEEEEEDQQLQPVAEDELALQFMDSVHNYLSLFDALSSTLGQVKSENEIQC